MNYEKKYNEALKKAKKLYEQGTITESLNYVFPELKESKVENVDEKVRKALIKLVTNHASMDLFIEYDIHLDEALVWLEKQAEQKSTLPKWKYKSDNTPLLRDSLILNEYGCVAKSPSGALVSDVWVIDYDELIKLPKEEFEKPGKQKETLCDKCKKAQPFHSCQDITALGRCAVEHEQKFYEGDWIACEELSTGKIIRLDSDRYEVEFIDGSKGFPHIDYVDRDFHLWTIQDAKDGDILYSIRVNAIILYKYRSSDGIYINTYCALQKGIFIKQEMLWDRDFVPATKEQRDLFFQKMKEAGYEWNAKKKELKKIEQKSFWSEEDEEVHRKCICAMRASACGFPEEEKFVEQVDNWLKSLKDKVQPQPRQKWSEEDEKMCQETIDWFEKKCFPYALESENPARESIKWLKSIKDRYTWKPSDEQMTALRRMKAAIGGEGEIYEPLNSLYEDLKKLREE